MKVLGQDNNNNITLIKFDSNEIENKKGIYSLVVGDTSLFLNKEEFEVLVGIFSALHRENEN